MRSIAEIIKDERDGKQLSQTEKQIAVAYIRGKYDAVMQLITSTTSTTVNAVLDMIRADIVSYCNNQSEMGEYPTEYGILQIIDKYRKEQ